MLGFKVAAAVACVLMLCAANDDEDKNRKKSLFEYMAGVQLRDVYDSHAEPGISINYSMTENVMAEITGDVGDYVFNGLWTTMKVKKSSGNITGNIKITAKIVSKTKIGTIRRDLNLAGTYRLETIGTDVNITIGLPEGIASAKLETNGCNALIRNGRVYLTIPNAKEEIVVWMSNWVTRLMEKNMPDVTCNAVEDELAKGSKSAVVRAAVAQVIAALLGAPQN